jgi:hypothetical protein
VPENILRLNTTDHILAHLIRYLEFGQDNDWKTYVFRKARRVDLTTRGKARVEKQRIDGKGRFDSALQSKLGKVGGTVGGSRNTPTQQAARSRVGQAYGRSTGIGNQSAELKELLTTMILFTHKDLPGERIIVGPQTTAIDVARSLNDECDKLNLPIDRLDLKKVQKGGAFYQLLRGQKKTIYGWSIFGKLDANVHLDDGTEFT